MPDPTSTVVGYLHEAPRLTTLHGSAILRWVLVLPAEGSPGGYSLLTCMLPDPHRDLDETTLHDAYPAGTYVQVTGHLLTPTPDQPLLLLVAGDLAPAGDPQDEPMPTDATVHDLAPYGPYQSAAVTTPDGVTRRHLWDTAGRWIGHTTDPALLTPAVTRHQPTVGD
ncbi:hypothetical protein ACFVXH_39635 [Kitasatospora sp. NPDC058184]|uniref:hypothetical protein n=1 Tax=Kitasatospora sp. NPDC058184 TaxID=3346370 RepID=UPI0036D827BD